MQPDPETTSTLLAAERYLARGSSKRHGVALALSGGGFRAALFHLGALRRLNELGVLSQVETVSSVSGGSIVAAFLADRLAPWPAEGETAPRFVEQVVAPVKRFTASNIRTGPVLRRLLPWNWLRRQTAVQALVSRYRRDVSGRTLSQLPQQPRFVFCATDLSYAVNWTFERERSGDYQVGYVRNPSWPLATAVAASSCFPPVFAPLKLGIEPSQLTGGRAPAGKTRDDIVRRLSLSDGGVYDNMGLEPVWKDHRVLLVSDGGATFDAGPDRGVFWQLQRYTAVIGEQAGAIRKRWLIAGFIDGDMQGTYWGIGSTASHYGQEGGYSESLVDAVVSEVRTDLDAFSEAEQAVLENHGYIMAQAAVQRHASQLIRRQAPFQVPYPQWLDEDRVRVAMAESHKRRLLGRG